MNNKIYKSINDVSDLLKIKKHVIRYWDSRFDGISTRLGERKRRFFSPENIKKLQTLKKMLHTNGKSHHSLEMAKKIIEKKIIKDDVTELTDKISNNLDINKLVKISKNLKILLKSL